MDAASGARGSRRGGEAGKLAACRSDEGWKAFEVAFEAPSRRPVVIGERPKETAVVLLDVRTPESFAAKVVSAAIGSGERNWKSGTVCRGILLRLIRSSPIPW